MNSENGYTDAATNPISFMKLMEQILTSFLLPAIVFASLAAPLASSEPAESGALESGFANPPASALPRTWWHWISGSVSKEGITADLEAMKRIGLGGAQIFSVDASPVRGSVVFRSQEWRDLVKHSLTEAERLSLEISMHSCDGWSISGGPWIQPEGSMQKVVWSESQVEGGKTIPLSVPQPEAIEGYYKDIALIAIKAPAGAPRIDHPVARAGMEVKMNLPFTKPAEALAGASAKDIMDLTGKKEWNAPAGQWTLLRIGHTSTGMNTKRSTTSGLECDKMSAEAVNFHIDNMFKPVWEDSPGKAGGTFKFLLVDSWEAKCANWTPRMPEEFRKRWGYDLQPWLPVPEATGIFMPKVAGQVLCKKYTDGPTGEFWSGGHECQPVHLLKISQLARVTPTL